MKVAVIGTGYVGLVTGACLANVGNFVTCVDKDEAKIAMLREGKLPIYEEGLSAIVAKNTEDSRLRFTTDTAEAVRTGEVIFIAVGTPPDEDGSADLKHVLAVARDIGEAMDEAKIVVCKSTVPVGTCDKVREVIESRSRFEVDVVSNPEFLKEGTAIKDFQSPDRVVIGCERAQAGEKVAELYKPFMRRSERIVQMDVRSAEMTKYASNAMLATKISFINEVASICERVGANVEQVRTGMALDERIGPHFIYPGVGFGGSCFPKDIRALGRLGSSVGVRAHMLEAVEEVNQKQKLALYRGAKQKFGSLKGRRLAVWGLSFKPRTDDVRESPALVNIERFVEEGATVAATDPEAIDNAKIALGEHGAVEFYEDDYAVLEGADALFIFTEWEQYRSPDFERMGELMRRAVVFDGRNLYQPAKMMERGFDYVSVGRPR